MQAKDNNDHTFFNYVFLTVHHELTIY